MLTRMVVGLALLIGCVGGPDEFEIGYGHMFVGDSMLEAWPINNEDSDWFSVGLVWKLRPTEVVVQERFVPVQDPIRELIPTLPPEVDEVASQVKETLSFLDALDWFTRASLLILACVVIWIFRRQIGRLIPRFGNNKKNNCK